MSYLNSSIKVNSITNIRYQNGQKKVPNTKMDLNAEFKSKIYVNPFL